jgi:propionyl-CoA carboxylase beta chain
MEEQKYLGDSVVTGWGRSTAAWSMSLARISRSLAAHLGEVHAEKVCKVMDLAMKNGAPLIGMNDSGGARIQEGVVSLAAYAYVFCATYWPRAWCPRSAPSWDRVRAALSIRRR